MPESLQTTAIKHYKLLSYCKRPHCRVC